MERRGLTVCHDCVLLLRQGGRGSQTRIAAPFALLRFHQTKSSTSLPIKLSARQNYLVNRSLRPQRVQTFSSTPRRAARVAREDDSALSALHNRILELTKSVLRPTDQIIPSEQRVLYVLEQLDAIVVTLDAQPGPGSKAPHAESERTATSSLLGSVNARQHSSGVTKDGLLDLVSEKAEEILRHPNVFITPAALRSYVDLQSKLHQPSSFPDIFQLYASKPTPTSKGSSEVQYTPVSPDKINAAVDAQTADAALTSAMAAHDLPLCIDIITTTFATPAFKKSKTLRQALAPAAIVAAAPAVAYGLSLQFGLLQHTMEPAHATGVAFAGIMTYVGTVCSLGYIVITTANDQMDRVTWAKGVPLWERWVREQERAALDRVAGKWGFQALERRGEEEGVEWESLKEFVGLRGMALDQVELMDGME